jgi:hypothetical protein
MAHRISSSLWLALKKLSKPCTKLGKVRELVIRLRQNCGICPIVVGRIPSKGYLNSSKSTYK